MQKQSSQQVMSELKKLAKSLDPLDQSRFEKLAYKEPDGTESVFYVYPEPLKRKDGSVISNLNFPQQLAFYPLASKELEVKLQHLPYRGVVEAFRAGGEFKKNVPDPCWIYTGEIAQQTEKGIDVRAASGARFVDAKYRESAKPSPAVLVQKGKTLSKISSKDKVESILQVQYDVSSVLQTSIATRTGRFGKFGSAVPVDSEITDDGDLYWGGISFEENLVAVRAGSDPGGRVLCAGADWPSDWVFRGVLPVVSRENPKK